MQRWLVPTSLFVAVMIVVAAFPLTSLLRQQSEIDSTNAAIALLQRQSSNLATQAKHVSSTAAAIALAREDYQLVLPGQRLIQVLPGKQSQYMGATSGDPGLQPLVSPQQAQLATLNGSPTAAHGATASTSTANGNFIHRLVRTLEFWR